MLKIFAQPLCPLGHQTRLVVFEKQIDAQIQFLNETIWPDEVINANPSGIGPTLIDRDITLYNHVIINHYLDERFPHPPLMPADPADRARIRLALQRIDQDWYQSWSTLIDTSSKSKKMRIMLRDDLIVLSPLFNESAYFMSQEFSLLDCSLAPLLWRLPLLDISLPKQAKPVLEYANRVFSRESFQASLNDQEKLIR